MAPGSLRERAAFERLLATRPLARSAHFAAHCVPGPAAGRAGACAKSEAEDLSTPEEQILSSSVDNMPARHLLGCLLPKRLARRAVTRNLLRREIRAAVAAHTGELVPGWWLIRLRAPWAPAGWHSAASTALRIAVRRDLAQLMRACIDALAPSRQRQPPGGQA